ncbi:MAG: hypothetical protein ACJ73N_11775 [Bryobacteraceae bacterium]
MKITPNSAKAVKTSFGACGSKIEKEMNAFSARGCRERNENLLPDTNILINALNGKRGHKELLNSLMLGGLTLITNNQKHFPVSELSLYPLAEVS